MIKKPRNSNVIYNDLDFEAFANWFNNLSSSDKIFKISDNKFTSLDTLEKIQSRHITTHDTGYFGMMSTGNHGSRRNLKNSVNNSKRSNPKLIVEGEEQENYFVLGFNSNGDIDLIFQNAGRGINSIQMKNYLEKYIDLYLTAEEIEKEFDVIEGTVVSTPDVMIDRLERITKTNIYYDKSVLNDELDLTNRTLQSKAEIVVEVRAQRNQDIRDVLEDARQKLVHSNTKIEKIWVEGKDNNGNRSSFFLNQIQKRTFVTLDIDNTTASLIKENVKAELINLL